MWARVELPSYQAYLMNSDGHTLAYWRVNAALQQYDKFYDTYDIKKGDGVYLDKDKLLSVL